MPKLKFESILEDFQTIPKAMLNILRYYLNSEGSAKLRKIKTFFISNDISRLVLIGHSYNYFASHIPFYFINENNKNCSIFEIDEFVKFYNSFNSSIDKKSVFIFISRSGNSLQIRQGIKKLENGGIDKKKIWSISSNPDSFLAKNSYLILPTKNGDEQVIGTKSYVSAILVLIFLARGFLNLKIISNKIENEIRQLIFEVKFFIQDWAFHVKSLTNFFGIDYKFLYFISKGASLSTAYQAAISCKSYTRTFGEGTSIGLFLHGPFQMVQKNPESFRCVLIIGDDSSLEETTRLIQIVSKKLGAGKVMLINNNRNLSSLARSNKNVWVFEHTTKTSSLAPIFEYIVVQFLLLDLALRKEVIEKGKN